MFDTVRKDVNDLATTAKHKVNTGFFARKLLGFFIFSFLAVRRSHGLRPQGFRRVFSNISRRSFFNSLFSFNSIEGKAEGQFF